MELQTKIDLPKAEFQISHGHSLMMLGSCFTENIGGKLSYFKFDVDINPCGIVYNPLSAAGVLKLLLAGKPFTEDSLMEYGGKWISLMHHGSFSSPDRAACLRQINERLIPAAGRLPGLDLLILTFGTAWVYRYKSDGRIVSNCHKIPASAFERFCLRPEEIVEEYALLIRQLQEVNPELRIIFTVSPIRHWKDGAHGNQLSKAVLLLAIDQLIRRFGRTYYFPSYEIVMDELRDYRFYAEDMLHVSPVAVEYIWERFQEVYIGDETRRFMGRVDKINKTLMHRPADSGSEKWLLLREKMLRETEEVEQEIRLMKARLK